jgi:multiple sugar transport system substrate-binding protein
MEKTMRPKTPAYAALLALTGAAVAACSGGNAGSSAGADEITLIMSNHPWQRAIEPHLAEFTKQTGVTVKVQTFAEQQMRDKIQLNLKSRSAAMDVFMTLPSREGPQFAQAGYYQGLDEYLAKSPAEYKADDFSQGAMSGMKVEGKTVGVPINVEGTALFYRADLFKKYGLNPPKSLDELQQVAATIKAKNEVTPIALRGVSAAIPYTFAPFLYSQGGQWTSDPTTPAMDSPQAVEAIQRYATLAKEYGPQGVINNTFTQSSALMAQGKVAMELESSNELSSVIDPKSSTVADKIGVASFPAGPAGSKPTVLSWALGMSNYSKNKDGAWKFIQWATSPETQLTLTDSGIAPPRKGVAQDPKYTATLDTQTKKQWAQVLTEIQETGNTAVGPVGVKAPAMREVVGDAIGQVILGRATAQQAAEQIQQGLTPLLANGG